VRYSVALSHLNLIYDTDDVIEWCQNIGERESNIGKSYSLGDDTFPVFHSLGKRN
jgi:hypothetical protein